MNSKLNPLNHKSSNGHYICDNCRECIDCGMCKCNIDLKLLAKRLSQMGTQSNLYKLIKNEVKKRGHWKYKQRGK